MFAVCAVLPIIYTKNLRNNMDLHMRNLEILCNNLSFTKYMCPNLFLEEASCGAILVSDHFPKATTKSLHFGWSLTAGSTLFMPKKLNLHLGK